MKLWRCHSFRTLVCGCLGSWVPILHQCPLGILLFVKLFILDGERPFLASNSWLVPPESPQDPFIGKVWAVSFPSSPYENQVCIFLAATNHSVVWPRKGTEFTNMHACICYYSPRARLLAPSTQIWVTERGKCNLHWLMFTPRRSAFVVLSLEERVTS
jgi:hypothetical protein